MNWIKKGLVLSERHALQFGLLNPQVPYAYKMTDRIRIFFGARAKDGGPAAIYYIDVDSMQPNNILALNDQPLLSCGSLGMFDQDGVLPVCVKKVGKEIYMYYGGFSKQSKYPHTCMMGLAISRDEGESFTKISNNPVLPISDIDPYLIGSADIIFYNGLYHMIYTSGTKWLNVNSSLEVSYTLKYAFSTNGIAWQPTGEIVIPQQTELDAFSKPSIFKINDLFVMYFSKRHVTNYREKGDSAYSFGVATSADLKSWERDDDMRGIDTSPEGWDSEMICYPNIVKANGQYIMFYNGNGFGKSGFGYAALKM